MFATRPLHGELEKKIKAAKTALMTRPGVYANVNKVVGELYELDIVSPGQVWKLILELLDEIRPENYAGGRPPQRSYEKTIEDRELFAFCWDSLKLGKKMYMKFALKEGRYYYVSLHESRNQL